MLPSQHIYGLPNEVAGYGYLNVPKAACSSIKTTIADHLGVAHQDCRLGTAEHTRGLDYVTARRDLFWFSFVRHPCDRLVSLWADYLQPPFPERELKINHDLNRWRGWPFDRFIREAMRRDPADANPHYAHQSRFLFWMGDCLADRVYRFENLAADWASLQDRFGLPDLWHCRATEHSPWQKIFTPELARLVRDWYRVDFENFGYKVRPCELA